MNFVPVFCGEVNNASNKVLHGNNSLNDRPGQCCILLLLYYDHYSCDCVGI